MPGVAPDNRIHALKERNHNPLAAVGASSADAIPAGLAHPGRDAATVAELHYGAGGGGCSCITSTGSSRSRNWATC